jgi:hypothetical protein
MCQEKTGVGSGLRGKPALTPVFLPDTSFLTLVFS